MQKNGDKEASPTAPVVVVSGLPRSGTSMMMAMLQAGGLPLLCDAHRLPDPDNPRGYYEYGPVRTLARDAFWLSRARGKAVKIISLHLLALPPFHRYQVIFMQRSLCEVLASQRHMLARNGTPPVPGDAQLQGLYEQHLAHVRTWLNVQSNCEVLHLEHGACIADPVRESHRVGAFLHRDLAVDAMAGAVDPALYRQRG